MSYFIFLYRWCMGVWGSTWLWRSTWLWAMWINANEQEQESTSRPESHKSQESHDISEPKLRVGICDLNMGALCPYFSIWMCSWRVQYTLIIEPKKVDKAAWQGEAERRLKIGLANHTITYQKPLVRDTEELRGPGTWKRQRLKRGSLRKRQPSQLQQLRTCLRDELSPNNLQDPKEEDGHSKGSQPCMRRQPMSTCLPQPPWKERCERKFSIRKNKTLLMDKLNINMESKWSLHIFN